MDVVFSDDSILQPDLLYIAKEHRSIISDHVNGAPDLVIEVLSPGSDRRDKTRSSISMPSTVSLSIGSLILRRQVIEFLLLEQGRLCHAAAE